MRIPRLVTSISQREMVRHLKTRRKMRVLGKGAFARVYGRDNYRRVIKVGVTFDSYLKYVSLIGLRSTNPYFPRLHSVQMCKDATGGRYYIIEMEKLIRWGRWPPGNVGRLLGKLGIDNLWDADQPELTKDSGRHEKELARVLRKLYVKQNNADVHKNNVMFRRKGRGYQLVYTDPVA